MWFTNYNNFYYSVDTGRTWQEYDLGVDSIKGLDIVFTDANHGWLLCGNGNIFYTDNNGGIVTGIDEENISNKIPESFVLYQNYPNPFNPTTEIKYALKQREHVLLKVYNISGEEVATLVNKNISAGTYSVSFNGKGLASGAYFYKLTVGNFTQSKKMVLLK